MNNWIENNKTYIIQYLLIVAILLMFKNVLQNLLVEIAELFNFESTEFKIGYIISVFIGLVGYMSLMDKKYIISKKGHLVAIVLFTAYIIFRGFDNGIIYLPQSTYLDYIDISVLFFLIHIIHWKNTKQRSPITNADKKDFFINDAVYVDVEIDNELIVKELIFSIKDYKPKNSFSIGINAEWGFGKSTFLHRFYKEYRKTNSETIMFWFHIWKNKGDKAIIDNFFKEFSTNLKPHSAEIEDNIEKYTDAILSISPGEISQVIKAGKNIFKEDHSLEEYYQKIQDAILRIDRQIIIILDDLDRLEESEILDTYKIIRTLSDFDNVIFLAGYDRNYLEKTLGKSKEKYINKIFQVELNLLPFDETKINEMFLDGIKKVFPHRSSQQDKSEEHINNEKLFIVFYNLFKKRSSNTLNVSEITLDNIDDTENKFVCSNLKLEYKHFIRTYRDLKRFLNEFKFNKSLVETKDLYLPDYILFRLLTFRYRNLYNIIFERIADIIEPKEYDNVNDKMQDSWNDDDGSHYIYTKDSKQRLIDKLRSCEYEDQDIEIINASLCILFGKKAKSFYNSNHFTISKRYYTNFYLRNGIPNEAYTYSKFEKSFNEDNLIDLINRMKGSSQNVRLQAFNELKLFLFNNAKNIKSKDDFAKFIVALNQFEDFPLMSDYRQLEEILQSLFQKIQGLNYVDLKDALIASKVSIGPIDRFLADVIINSARKKRSELYTNENSIDYKKFPLNIDNTKSILLAKFKHFVPGNIGYNIYFNYYVLQIDFIAEDHKIILAYEADKIFKAKLEKFFLYFVWGDLLDFKGEPEVFQKEYRTYKPNDFLCQIFCNKEDWNALKESPIEKEKYKTFRQNGFRYYNEYLKTKEVKNIVEGEDHKSKFEKIKKLMEAFISNDYQPLNRTQFEHAQK